MKAMEYTDASGDTSVLHALIDDHEWIGQQKFDGTRVLIDLSMQVAQTRKGTPLKHTAALQHMNAIWGELIQSEHMGRKVTLDGELIVSTGEYHVFDLILHEQPHATLVERLAALASFFAAAESHTTLSKVRRVRTAISQSHKIRLIQQAEEIGCEGVMLKRLDGIYEHGERVDHGLKFKFVKTAEVVVTATTQEPLSAKLAVYARDEDGLLELRQVGGASLIGKGRIVPGDVVEVNYLYWTGTRLYQPRIMRKRADKWALDCKIEQLPEYSRDTVVVKDEHRDHRTTTRNDTEE